VSNTPERSKVLPTDPFDIALAEKIGLPNGAHTALAALQVMDAYGNSTQFNVQTVKTDEGEYVFVTQTGATPSDFKRYVLTPKLLALIDRQRQSTITMVRRRHGRRLAEQRSNHNPFTAEMRAKALASRKRNAARRRKAR